MKVWDKKPIDISLKLTKSEAIDLGITEKALEMNEQRGELKSVGPWSIPVSYKALAMSTVWTPEDERHYSSEIDKETAYGLRTLTDVRQSGHQLEGRVSINGKRYSAFTSSQLFEIDGKLVDVATIQVRMEKQK